MPAPKTPPDFARAVEAVLAHEGGYVDDPADPGGETRFGISKRSYPSVDIRNLTREGAIAIYKRDWWDRYGYGELRDHRIAAKVFDLAINMGAPRAHMLLQQALHAVELPTAVDGQLGPATITSVALADPWALLAALRSEAAGFYRLLAARRPGLERFEKGWLTRAYS